MQDKKHYKDNIYVATTIFAIIATAIYAFIIKFLYSSYVNTLNAIVFFIVVWVVYLWLTRRAYRRFERIKKNN